MGASGSERGRATAGASGAVGTADVGLLCTQDFKISPEAASVCEEVTRFAALACLSELFRRMPTEKMFRSIEANAMRVSLDMHIHPL